MIYNVMVKLLLLAAGVAAAPKTTACNEDNCLRAVSGSAFPTRVGSSDCASYFLTTVTPKTSTHTVTVTTSPTLTRSSTITNTGTETEVATITNTATIISDQTITSTTTATDVITDTVTISATFTFTLAEKEKYAIREDRRAPKGNFAARQVTVVHSAIPSYASACSGSVRYSSACSCLGVTKSTTTAPTPITTKTVTATTPHSLVLTQTSSATATVLTTETDSATVTSIITETSVVTATVAAPTTVSETDIVATQTIGSCGPTPPFILIAYGSGTAQDGSYVSLGDADDRTRDHFLVLDPDVSAAATFQIDLATGYLSSGGYYANTPAGATNGFLYFDTPFEIADIERVYATCVVGPSGGGFSCADQGSALFEFDPSEQPAAQGEGGVLIAQSIDSGYAQIFFEAVCLD